MPSPADIAMLRNLCQSLRRRSSRLASLGSLPAAAQAEAEGAVNSSNLMEEIVKKRFDEKATDGVSWAERKKAYPWPMLQRTGTLLRAAINAVRFSYRISGTRWNISSLGVPYARYVNDGTPRMDARPFLQDPSEEELRKADRFAARVARRVLRRMMRS